MVEEQEDRRCYGSEQLDVRQRRMFGDEHWIWCIVGVIFESSLFIFSSLLFHIICPVRKAKSKWYLLAELLLLSVKPLLNFVRARTDGKFHARRPFQNRAADLYSLSGVLNEQR